MKKNLLLILGLIILSGCGNSLFFEKEKLNSLKSANPEESTLFFEKKFQVTETGQLFEFTHIIIQNSANRKNQNELLLVPDNSQIRLLAFSARLVSENGAETNYSTGNLIKFSTSNASQISESYIKLLPISEDIKPGDIIEMVYSHERSLPGLGITFSADYAGKNSKYTSLIIEIPKDKDLFFKVYNDSISPNINTNEKQKSYSFVWKNYKTKENPNVFSKKDDDPLVLATMPILPSVYSTQKISTWTDFGNWYMTLIESKLKSDKSIKSMADSLSGGTGTTKEKIDAVFNFCQKNIRYEQVYLDKGEFIPNDYDVILKRKYGDCKDYSMVIYTLIKNMGFDPKLALCYRGRGNEFFDEMPVSQFNHMIVYCSIDGKDYWYDGTNRIGLAGIPTSDLINQTALIIDKNNSHLKKIEESPDNLFLIEGSLKEEHLSLNGKLVLSFSSQYAIDFNYVNMLFNKDDMKNYLSHWMKANLNTNISIKTINWQNKGDRFVIETDAELPNSILSINSNYYFSFSRTFPNLLASSTFPENSKSVFYYPDYSKIKVNLKLENLTIEEKTSDDQLYQLNISSGPYSEMEKLIFVSEYKKNLEKFNQKVKFTGRK